MGRGSSLLPSETGRLGGIIGGNEGSRDGQVDVQPWGVAGWEGPRGGMKAPRHSSWEQPSPASPSPTPPGQNEAQVELPDHVHARKVLQSKVWNKQGGRGNSVER